MAKLSSLLSAATINNLKNYAWNAAHSSKELTQKGGKLNAKCISRYGIKDEDLLVLQEGEKARLQSEEQARIQAEENISAVESAEVVLDEFGNPVIWDCVIVEDIPSRYVPTKDDLEFLRLYLIQKDEREYRSKKWEDRERRKIQQEEVIDLRTMVKRTIVQTKKLIKSAPEMALVLMCKNNKEFETLLNVADRATIHEKSIRLWKGGRYKIFKIELLNSIVEIKTSLLEQWKGSQVLYCDRNKQVVLTDKVKATILSTGTVAVQPINITIKQKKEVPMDEYYDTLRGIKRQISRKANGTGNLITSENISDRDRNIIIGRVTEHLKSSVNGRVVTVTRPLQHEIRTKKYDDALNSYHQYIFGPHAYCDECHGGVTEDSVEKIRQDLDAAIHVYEFTSVDDYIASGRDIRAINNLIGELEDAERDLASSFTELEPLGEGFFSCPSCGNVYVDENSKEFDICEHITDDGREVKNSFVDPLSRREADISGDKVLTRAKFVNAVWDNMSDDKISYDEHMKNIITALYGDIKLMAKEEYQLRYNECINYICSKTELMQDMSDPLGNAMYSYEEYNGIDDDENLDSDKDSGSGKRSDVQEHGNKILPWVGKAVDISGMTDFITRNERGIEVTVEGIFQRYYLTGHKTMAQKIKDKATACKLEIDKLVEEFAGTEYPIYPAAIDGLRNRLYGQWEYWTSWCDDQELDGYTIYQLNRSIALDYYRDGGTLKYYTYQTKDGGIGFSAHPDTYTSENKEYVDGDIFLLLDNDKYLDICNVMNALSNTATDWSYYKSKFGWKINALAYDKKGNVIGGFAANATPEIAAAFRLLEKQPYRYNTYNHVVSACKSSNVGYDNNLNYFVKRMQEALNIEPAEMSLRKQVSSNKFVTQWYKGLPSEEKEVTIRCIKQRTAEEVVDMSYAADVARINKLKTGRKAVISHVEIPESIILDREYSFLVQ